MCFSSSYYHHHLRHLHLRKIFCDLWLLQQATSIHFTFSLHNRWSSAPLIWSTFLLGSCHATTQRGEHAFTCCHLCLLLYLCALVITHRGKLIHDIIFMAYYSKKCLFVYLYRWWKTKTVYCKYLLSISLYSLWLLKLG